MCGGLLAGYIRLFGEPNDAGSYEVHGCLHLFVLAAIWFCALPLPELLWGRGVGKWLAGLRVVMKEGLQSPPRPAAVVKRQIAAFAEIFMCGGLLALIVMATGKTQQRLGDMWANTFVLDENSAG